MSDLTPRDQSTIPYQSKAKLHRRRKAVSIFHPFVFARRYITSSQFQNLFKPAYAYGTYEFYSILTTRDINVVNLSKRKQFQRDYTHLEHNRKTSADILASIIERSKPW